MKMIPVLLLLLAVMLGGHYYVCWHVYNILPFPLWGKVAAVALMVLAFALSVLSVLPALDRLPFSLATALYEIGTSWIFIFLYLLLAFAVLDLGRLLHIVPSSVLVNNVVSTVLLTVVMLSVFVYGNMNYNSKHRESFSVETAKAVDGKRIVLVSDLHLGYNNHRKEFSRWVDMINAENPDLVLVAGDIIDRSVEPLDEERVVEEFHRIKAPVVACLGNHEYLAGIESACRFYDEAGIILLRDSAVSFGNITIVGRDDKSNVRRLSLAQIMQKNNVNADSSFVILLDHQPFNLEQAEEARVDFQFSGHTHYGQVWPVSWITDAIYEKAYGAHRRGGTFYYVSSGLGIWGGKYRIGTRSEYVVATLCAGGI